MSDTTPVQAFDEVYDAEGKMVSRVTRDMPDRVPSDLDLRDIRRQLRAVARNTAVPAWGRVLARALLLYTWMDNDPTAGT